MLNQDKREEDGKSTIIGWNIFTQ